MINQYPQDFTRLWDAFNSDFGRKGSKKAAYKEFVKLKLTPEDVDFIINKIVQQIAEKQQFKLNGQWIEDFQHVERWLKNARWEDETAQCRENSSSAGLPKTGAGAMFDPSAMLGDYEQDDRSIVYDDAGGEITQME